MSRCRLFAVVNLYTYQHASNLSLHAVWQALLSINTCLTVFF